MQIKNYTLSSSQHLSWDNSQKLNFRYIQHICFKCPPSPANSSSILLKELWGMLNSYDIQPKKNLRDYITFEVSRVFCPREWWCPKHVVYTVLPGMYSTPVLAVPRKGKLRLCNHHSFRKFSLNSMIDRDNIARVKLDGICELGESLRIFRWQHGNEPLVVFKSDVKAAYRRMPVHYLWQIKQVVTFEGLRRVDQVACFGSRGSQILFMAFMSLVTWVALYIFSIDHLKDYVDDSFSFERADQSIYYLPYRTTYPTKQAWLL